MRIYLAGPMRGHPGNNFPAFDAAKKYLEFRGHDVVSPADMDRAVGFSGEGHDPIPLRDHIIMDLLALSTCDALALMDGWEQSKGAAVEVAFSRYLGRRVYLVDELLAPLTT